MKGYTVAIANLPFIPNKKIKEFMDYISKLDGFIGVHPHYPNGTLLIFKSENHAKRARNLIEKYGVKTGRNICEVNFDDR